MVDRLTKKEQDELATRPKGIAIPTLEERLLAKKEELLAAQKGLHDQDVGIANQLFLIEQLLNPQPAAKAPPETDTPPKPPPEPPGTI